MLVLPVLAAPLLQEAKHGRDHISSAKLNLLHDGVADTLVSVDATDPRHARGLGADNRPQTDTKV